MIGADRCAALHAGLMQGAESSDAAETIDEGGLAEAAHAEYCEADPLRTILTPDLFEDDRCIGCRHTDCEPRRMQFAGRTQ